MISKIMHTNDNCSQNLKKNFLIKYNNCIYMNKTENCEEFLPLSPQFNMLQIFRSFTFQNNQMFIAKDSILQRLKSDLGL